MTKRQFYKALRKAIRMKNPSVEVLHKSSAIYRYIDSKENIYCPLTLVCYSEKNVFVHCNLPFTAAKMLGLTTKDWRDIANSADGSWTKSKRTVETLARINKTFTQFEGIENV